MRHAAALAIVLAGCYRPANGLACETTCPCPDGLECGPDNVCRAPGTAACTTRTIDAPPSDSRADAELDGPRVPDDAACLGNLLGVRLCLRPGAARSFPTERAVIDTSGPCDVTMPQAGGQGPGLCVVAGTSIVIDGPVSVVGPRALVLLSTSSIAIQLGATLDASSHRGANPTGPAADNASCATALDGAAQTNPMNDGGGGGAGGSFGGVGGAGGGGLTSNGGKAVAELAPTYVRGGCRGGAGGVDLATPGSQGSGGHGGGAVYLLAASTITVDGTIDASGAGGGAAAAQTASGAGGGGSGGLIVLDAPLVTLTGMLLASGAGGGGGADPSSMGTPTFGNDPANTNAPNGGANSGVAGGGGTGSSRFVSGGGAGSFGGNNGTVVAGTGGGGGGGGAGHIIIFPQSASTTDTNIAPMPE